MPIYEEKLISPFAIHFTQEHIKTHFQDGRLVEATVPEIQASPSGSGDYDIILKAPFPNIEILRWHPHDSDEKVQRWYTLDNRRLYCLQRMAAEHWPKRVAAVVDILYADNGKGRRKYDSTTAGRSVTISPSVKVPAITRWDWRLRVSTPDAAAAATAMEAVEIDSAKPSVFDLCDVPGPAFETVLRDQTASFVSSLATLLSAKQPVPTPQVAPSSTESTAASSSDDSAESRQGTPREAAAAKNKLVWRVKAEAEPLAEEKAEAKDEKVNDLEQQAVRLVQAQLAQPGRKGFVWIDSWNERFQRQLGSLRAFLESKPEYFIVKPGRGRSYRVEAVPPSQDSGTGKWRNGKQSRTSRAVPKA